MTWATLLDNDLDLLLPFKWNLIRPTLGYENNLAFLKTTSTFGFSHTKHSLT